MRARLHVLLGAHPSRTAMLMLEHKGIDYELRVLPPLLHPVLVRLAGFRPGRDFRREVDDRAPFMLRLADRLGTVPALELDGRRAMTNHAIARLLDELRPEPPLFPADPVLRREVEAAERWGDEVLQMTARRLVMAAGAPRGVGITADGGDGRLGPLLYRRRSVRRAVVVFVSLVAFRANPRTEQAMLAELPAILDRVDGWIEHGVLGGEELSAADYMIVTSLALLAYRPDIAAELARRPAIRLLDRILPDPAGAMAPAPAL